MDSALITVLANLGFGGIIVILIVAGYLVPKPAHTRVLEESARKDEIIEHLQAALALERQQSNEVARSGAVTNQLISGLLQLAGRSPDGTAGVLPVPPVPGLPDGDPVS